MVKTIQTDVLRRFMSEADLKSFLSQYRDNLYRHKKVKQPNEKDIKVGNLFRKHLSYNAVAKLLGIPSHQVRASVGRLYAHKR